MTNSSQPSRKELRFSLLLPVVITIVVWLIGLAVYALTPGDVQFNNVIAILIGAGLIGYLVFYMRNVSARLRVVALLMAVPAMIGITLGTVNGRSTPILVGFGITFLLLLVQRAFNVPLSYRAAAQAYDRGEFDQALELINKSIQARPDFAESYQLRAMIRLVNQQIGAAEKDAQKAIELSPKVDQFYNTLGQIYLVNGRFAEMRDTYQQAIEVNPDRAMNHYHLGLSNYRLGDFREAAETLSMATRKAVPNMTYDLLTHYYLWRSLLEIGQTELAQTTHETMQNFADALEELKISLDTSPELMHTPMFRDELEDLSRQLSQ